MGDPDDTAEALEVRDVIGAQLSKREQYCQVPLPPGRITPEDEDLLFLSGHSCRVAVELGTFCGRAATILAQSCRLVVTMDIFHLGDKSPGYDFNEVKRAMPGNVLVLKRSANTAIEGLRDIDLLFVDANHSYDSTKKYSEAWWPTIRPGGTAIFHDYTKAWPGVMRAVDELLEQHDAEDMGGIGWCKVIRKAL